MMMHIWEQYCYVTIIRRTMHCENMQTSLLSTSEGFAVIRNVSMMCTHAYLNQLCVIQCINNNNHNSWI